MDDRLDRLELLSADSSPEMQIITAHYLQLCKLQNDNNCNNKMKNADKYSPESVLTLLLWVCLMPPRSSNTISISDEASETVEGAADPVVVGTEEAQCAKK